MQIQSIKSWWVLDSRGNPTVCVSMQDPEGNYVKSFVPSGASTGVHEALELRDNTTDFGGKGVNKVITNINTIIAEVLIGYDATVTELEQKLLYLDMSDNKSGLGANAILGVSMALHRLSAIRHKVPLAHDLSTIYFTESQYSFPRLMCNIINGGVHADSGLAIQEFMVIPRTGSLVKDVQAASEIYQTLKKQLKNTGQITSIGDEGGFAPHFAMTRDALIAIMSAINTAGYTESCDIAMDCAASEFFDASSGTYHLDQKTLSKTELIDFYTLLCQEFPIISIEDGCAEDDLEGWALLTTALGQKIKLVGDDLFVTNVDRIQSIGIDQHIANALLVKPNQIGSVTETIAAIKLARNHGMTTIISHRSGETEDTFISDLAVASASEFIKLGAPARGERTAKYNRLLELYHNQ